MHGAPEKSATIARTYLTKPRGERREREGREREGEREGGRKKK